MATSGLSHRLHAPGPDSLRPGASGNAVVTTSGGQYSTASILWMVMDAITVIAASLLAFLFEHDPAVSVRWPLHKAALEHCPPITMIALLCGFTAALILTSRRLMLYSPSRLNGLLNEQRLSVQACAVAGLLLIDALYFVGRSPMLRELALFIVGTVTILISLRRLMYRWLFCRHIECRRSVRNILIVGTGPEAHALRDHINSMHSLGYTFKGFVTLPGQYSSHPVTTNESLGTLETLFHIVRQQFVDEIFFAAPCDRIVLQSILDQSRAAGVDLRVVPCLYDGLTWNHPIEFIGRVPTIPLHRNNVPELKLAIKRGIDILISALALTALFPLIIAVSIVVKLDSEGPVFYLSERVGRKGRLFYCVKFRTMVHDADERRAEILHMNERDGVLFKITRDPRITRIGRILRKYSFDELPQFYNVLRGDMSIVGPRPPLASEVREYKLSHLRRLDVKPGITGLWQVQARQDPSFDSYISWDFAYIETWDLWLDFKILLRTIAVVLQGTGS